MLLIYIYIKNNNNNDGMILCIKLKSYALITNNYNFK